MYKVKLVIAVQSISIIFRVQANEYIDQKLLIVNNLTSQPKENSHVPISLATINT